jgi:hypothetical protein
MSTPEKRDFRNVGICGHPTFRKDFSGVGSAHAGGCSELHVKNDIRARSSLPCAIVIGGVVTMWGMRFGELKKQQM